MKITSHEAEKTLINKVIRFTDKVEDSEVDFDSGMLARIKDIQHDIDNVYGIRLDYAEFEEHNLPLMRSNYYDSNGVPCETWAQQSWYEKNKKEGEVFYVEFIYKGELVDLPFEIAEDKYQRAMPTLNETLDALFETLKALKHSNNGIEYNCKDAMDEANRILHKAGRDIII